MVNKLINELSIKEDLIKIPVLIYTLTLKRNVTKALNTTEILTLRKQYYKQI